MAEQKQVKNTNGKSRFRPAGFIAVIVFALAAVVATSISFTNPPPTNADAADIAAVVKSERIRIAIDGMYCINCAKGITAILKRTPGVISADVSFERKEAVVEFNPAETSRQKIVEAINDMGYQASVKE